MKLLLMNMLTKFNEYRLQNNKQSVEEVLIERAVETTIQILYDKGLFNHYNNGDASKVLKLFY